MTTAIATSLFAAKAAPLAPTAAGLVQAPPAVQSKSLFGKIEVQALSADAPVKVKKDAAVEKMVELIEQVLTQAITVNGEKLPAWTGAKVKSRGYLIFLEIPGYKRMNWKQGQDGKWAIEKKDGVEQYRRKSNIRIPLMNAKDFIALSKDNHQESLYLLERMVTIAPFAKGLLDTILNRAGEFSQEVERRLGVTA